MKRVLLLNLIFCLLKLGVSQTITVSPDVICEGENSYIGTDTNLNYVNIGDIICVGNTAHDTIIVRPEAWSRYSSTYTALSVVFYVDETGKHGWAVGMPMYYDEDENKYYYDSQSWSYMLNEDEELVYINLTCLSDYNENGRQAVGNFSGLNNTICIRGNQSCEIDEELGEVLWCDYPAVMNVISPFYLPAIGQLNSLYSYQYLINEKLALVLGADVGNFLLFEIEDEEWEWYNYWWSSTENDAENAFAMEYDGSAKNHYKDEGWTILPVMDF